MENEKYTYDRIKIGDNYRIDTIVNEDDIVTFAKISKDTNPIHLDEEYAQKTSFKGRIAPGMFIASFISSILGTKFPGMGTIYLSQEIKFLAPVRIGDTITTIVEAIEKDEIKKRIILKTECYNQDGKCVITGKAKVIPPNI